MLLEAVEPFGELKLRLKVQLKIGARKVDFGPHENPSSSLD